MSTKIRRIKDWFCYPVLGTLLETRIASAVLMLVLVPLVVSAGLGITLYRCPLLKLTGVPCPGCGLSRGTAASVFLDPAGIWHWHVFGPFALIGVAVVLLAGVLPDQPRKRFMSRIAWIEKKTGVTNFAFSLLWVYWVGRLIVLGGSLGVRLSAQP